MSITTAAPRATAADISLEALRRVFDGAFARDFSVRLWDGTSVPAEQRERFVLCVNTPYAMRAALTPPLDLSPGRAFVNGLLDCEGDLEAGVDALLRAINRLSGAAIARILPPLLRLPRPPRGFGDGQVRLSGRRHSRWRDAAAIGFHYDQPLAFYRSFLDPRLVYSCAYFDDGITELEDAQLAKIDYTLRKVRLAPGERLLDVGCGWGALVIRAAQRFGAHALGITLSRGQFDEAQRRIAELGLEGRVQVELLDYRELGARTFDRIVSLGMVEHVGRERLDHYFAVAYRALRPGGLFLNHGIAEQGASRAGDRSHGFIDRYVFPDGDLLPVSTSLIAAERAGFEVRDVENLREHYARTLRAWIANLERNAPQVVAATNERTYRIWRLYMAGSAQGFASGRMGIFQSLLAKPDQDGAATIPATRRWLYA